jgi:hypothetical protein
VHIWTEKCPPGEFSDPSAVFAPLNRDPHVDFKRAEKDPIAHLNSNFSHSMNVIDELHSTAGEVVLQ